MKIDLPTSEWLDLQMSPIVRRRKNGYQINMFFAEHNPPLVHIICSEGRASIAIESQEVIQGHKVLSPRILASASDWIRVNKDALLEMWNKRMDPEGIYIID